MRTTQFAATALLVVASTAVMAGVANGTPAAGPHIGDTTAQVHGRQHGVDFAVTRIADGHSVDAVLTGGTFAVNGNIVTIRDQSGHVIGGLPTAFSVAGQQVNLQPVVNRRNSHLTLKSIGHWEWTTQRQLNGQIGLVIGGLIGLPLGALILGIMGFGILSAITIPIGMLVGTGLGALAGAGIGAAIPASDQPYQKWTGDCHPVFGGDNNGGEVCF